MAVPILADRVRETTTTSGTGSFALAGARTGYRTFLAAVGTGNTCYYAVLDASTGAWEVGLGTLSGSTTLARTTVYSSSNGGSAVSFAANVKEVFVTTPASRHVSLDALGMAKINSRYGDIQA